MLNCFTLLLLSLILVIINHKCYLDKEKATGFTNSVYMFICMLPLYKLLFLKFYFLFVVKNFYALEFNNCKFDKNKNKNLNKKRHIFSVNTIFFIDEFKSKRISWKYFMFHEMTFEIVFHEML